MTAQSIRSVDDDAQAAFVESAKTRLVFAAPGLNRKVARALAERYKSLEPENVDIILDVDPEVVRLGYGDLEALKGLQEAAEKLGSNINRQEGMRIGLTISDSQ